MSKVTTIEYDGVLIPVHYERGRPFLQVKSLSTAAGVSLSFKDHTVRLGYFGYVHYKEAVERLRKVKKSEAQQKAYALADHLNDQFDKTLPVQHGHEAELTINVGMSADPLERAKEKEKLERMKSAIDKRLAMHTLAEELERGEYE